MNLFDGINDGPKISSRAKAAMLVRFFPKESSRKIVELLSAEEQQILAKELANMPSYDRVELESVLNEYLQFFRSQNIGLMGDGIEYIKDLFKHLPESEIKKMIGNIYYDMENPFEFLSHIKELDALLTFLNGEDPQMIAVVCSYLQPKQAAQLLESLPEEKRIKTVLSIAKLDQIDSEFVVNMSKTLDKKLSNMSFGDQNKADGIKKIVSILNNVSRGTEKNVFERLDEIDLSLAEEIRDNMFLFEDLVTLDMLSLQKVLNEIPDIQLIAKALKSTTEELKEMIMGSMSEGRRDSVTEELDALGGIRMVEIEEAQQQIAAIVKQMEKDNKINLVRGEDDVIY